MECEKERGDQGATNFSLWPQQLEGSGCHSMRLGRTERKIKSSVLDVDAPFKHLGIDK